ncbi:MAG TPA: hypothetical protein VGD77_03640 [Gemmatimonadaceae bacterium]
MRASLPPLLMAAQPHITESELREWLLDAGLVVDDATIARLLVRLQPMRARLRGAGLAQLEPSLRGHALAAGWKPSRGATDTAAAGAPGVVPGGRLAVPAFPMVRDSPAPARFFRGGNWGTRAFLLYLTGVVAFFGLSMMMSPTPAAALIFVPIGAGFLFVAVTGRGLSGSDEEAPPRTWRDYAAGFVLWVFGAGVVLGSLGLLLQGVVLMRSGPRAFSASQSISSLGMIGAGITVRRAVRYWREHYD